MQTELEEGGNVARQVAMVMQPHRGHCAILWVPGLGECQNR